VPFLLGTFLNTSSSGSTNGAIKVQPTDLALKLVLTVLLPTLVGMTLRGSSKRIRLWVTRHKTALSLFSTTNLIMIVWQALSGEWWEEEE